MNSVIQNLIADIELWLSGQTPAKPDTAQWYAMGSLKGFVSALKADDSEASLEKASWGLSRQLSDQLDWPSEHCKAISQFLVRARRLQKS